jgi:glycosyltransferase involved in cell wall biosynthesis
MLIQEYAPIIGGGQTQLAAQAEALAELGVDVRVLTRRWRPELLPVEQVGPAIVYRLPASGPKAVAAIRYILSAAWMIGRLRPDLLHAHELLSPTSAAILGKWLFRKPVVATVLGGGSLGDLKKIQRGRLGRLRSLLVLKSVDLFVVISDEIERELEGLGVPEGKRLRIPNGVDTERFTPASATERQRLREQLCLPDGRLAIFTGRLEPEKQVAHLLEIWPKLRQRVPDAQLLVLGTGSLEAALREQAPEGVQFLGGRSDVAPYLRAADLFVLASSREGLSVSMLEAMASGLPVLVTRVGGAADVVTDRENGWLIPAGDMEALLEGLVTLLKDQDLCRLLGSRARARVVEGYAVRSLTGQLRDAYDRLG